VSQLVHLGARFFRSLRARRPVPIDQTFVAEHLDEPLARVFWQQPVADLDHAVRGGRWIAAQQPGRPDLVRAYLLHDIGKRHSRLGTWGRSIVTALSLIRLPVGDRGRTYLEHGPIGADELEAVGAGSLAVSFARHHTGHKPGDIGIDDWKLLVEADRR
jgi:hypothetical protein